MTVTATKLVNRDIYAIAYDGGGGGGMITASLENPDTGDESGVYHADDGGFNVTVATGYEGTCEVTVKDAQGNILDEGTVEFGPNVATAPPDPNAPVVEPVQAIDGETAED